MKTYHKLLLIGVVAFLLRLALAQWAEHPGIADPNHYYNVGRRLAEGHGLTVNYIWQFNNDYATITHPEDHWMPLTSVLVAAAITLFGTSVQAAFVPFMLIGAFVLPALAYLAARQLRCSPNSSLFVAAAAALLPEYVMNSLRTDTTLPNAALITTSILLLTAGLRRGRVSWFVGAGLAAGLAYLNRSDSALMLPMLAVTLIAYRLWGQDQVTRAHLWRAALLIPLAAAVLVVPWIVRNIEVTGLPSSTTDTSTMFFLTDIREHYVYSTDLTLERMLERQTPRQLIGKRLFELAASLKLMYTTLDIALPVAVWGGLLLLLLTRDRERLLVLAPTLILLAGFYVFYAVLVPYKSQGGSFKKTFLSLIPLLLPLAGLALERAIADLRLRTGTMLLILVFLAANAVELTRADQGNTNRYLATMRDVIRLARSLPDTNGDGEIVLMPQDQFMTAYLGLRSVVIPMEDRDVVLEVARRYGVDYLMMPPARPSLDEIYEGKVTDPRFVPVAALPGTAIEFYRFDFATLPPGS